jgi:hypothetical protein
LFDKSLDSWDRFGLVWNAMFFLWSVWDVVVDHDGFGFLFMVLFGGLFVFAYNTATKKREAARVEQRTQQ